MSKRPIINIGTESVRENNLAWLDGLAERNFNDAHDIAKRHKDTQWGAEWLSTRGVAELERQAREMLVNSRDRFRGMPDGEKIVGLIDQNIARSLGDAER